MHLENLSNNNFVGDTIESGKIDISKKSLLVILISTFTKLKLPFWEHAFSCYDFLAIPWSSPGPSRAVPDILKTLIWIQIERRHSSQNNETTKLELDSTTITLDKGWCGHYIVRISSAHLIVAAKKLINWQFYYPNVTAIVPTASFGL